MLPVQIPKRVDQRVHDRLGDIFLAELSGRRDDRPHLLEVVDAGRAERKVALDHEALLETERPLQVVRGEFDEVVAGRSS